MWLEGFVLLVVAVAVFLATEVAWWWLPVLLFVPDVLALGYLAGPGIGAVAYAAACRLGSRICGATRRMRAPPTDMAR